MINWIQTITNSCNPLRPLANYRKGFSSYTVALILGRA